jgi:hypothetical protein
MEFLILFIGILGLLFAVIWFRKRNTEVAVVRSKVDNKDYVVQNKPDKQKAADMLAQVRQRMIKLVDCLKKNNGQPAEESKKAEAQADQKQFGNYETRLNRLVMRFNPDKISEGNEDTKFTTYTLNKGDKVVFCLRARDEDDRVHDLNLMTFVAVHELAHIASVTEHHTDEFKSNFAWLLEHAVKCGVYQPEDFRNAPRNYCGISVTDTPLKQF